MWSPSLTLLTHQPADDKHCWFYFINPSSKYFFFFCLIAVAFVQASGVLVNLLSKKRALICSVFWDLWCRYPTRAGFKPSAECHWTWGWEEVYMIASSNQCRSAPVQLCFFFPDFYRSFSTFSLSSLQTIFHNVIRSVFLKGKFHSFICSWSVYGAPTLCQAGSDHISVLKTFCGSLLPTESNLNGHTWQIRSSMHWPFSSF